VELAETAVGRERLCIQTPVARQWLGDHNVIAATVAHAKIAKLLVSVFSMWSAPFSVRSVRGLYANAGWTSLVSLQRECEVGVGGSPACKDVSPEPEERPPLEAVIGQRD
jgi:hypothetical protein